MNIAPAPTVTPLDPIVSEFATQEQAQTYDTWFRAKVERSLADTRPAVPHDEAMLRLDAAIARGKEKYAANCLAV